VNPPDLRCARRIPTSSGAGRGKENRKKCRADLPLRGGTSVCSRGYSQKVVVFNNWKSQRKSARSAGKKICGKRFCGKEYQSRKTHFFKWEKCV